MIDYFFMKDQKINSTNPSGQKLNELLKYYQSKRYHDAEKLALSITNDFPKHIVAWKVLGIILKKTGRINEALLVNQKSLELEPTNTEANFNLGNTLQQLERFEEAELCYRKAISIKPDYTEAYNNLGATLQKIGKFGLIWSLLHRYYKLTIITVPECPTSYICTHKPKFRTKLFSRALELDNRARFKFSNISFFRNNDFDRMQKFK